MEEINSVASRKLSATASMQHIEKSAFAADARIRIRWDQAAKARVGLGVLFAFPFAAYLIHGFVSPSGFLQNPRASGGAYMNWTQNFL